jgi:hypothetical protein
VCVCVRERERERESKISKQKVLCWNPIVCIHMVPALKLTLGIFVRDKIKLWDMSGGGWAELKGGECSTERACVFLCERLVGRGRKTNSNLDGGREIHEVRVCDSDDHREMRYVCVWERLNNSFTYHYLAIVDVHRLNINQYLLRIVAKDTVSIQRYKDWTLTYHIFFKSYFSFVHAKVTVMFLQTTIVVIMYMHHC